MVVRSTLQNLYFIRRSHTDDIIRTTMLRIFHFSEIAPGTPRNYSDVPSEDNLNLSFDGFVSFVAQKGIGENVLLLVKYKLREWQKSFFLS